MPSFQSAVCCLALAATTTQALQITYCSSDNTGYGHSAGSNVYQTLGACRSRCSGQDSFSWAIVQGNSCWCANDEPSDSSQVALTECDQRCPGYPTQTCGSENKGLFGYIAVQGSATTGSGTSSASTQIASSGAVASPSSSMVSPAMNSTATRTTVVVAPQNSITSSPIPVYTGAADKTFGTWNSVAGTGVLEVLSGFLLSLAL